MHWEGTYGLWHWPQFSKYDDLRPRFRVPMYFDYGRVMSGNSVKRLAAQLQLRRIEEQAGQ